MGVSGCNSGLFKLLDEHHETDLPTVDDSAQADARIPRAHENACRSCGYPRPPRQGPRAPGCLIVTKATYSFPRARRLDGPHAYAEVFAYKCWVNGRWFQVYAKPNGAELARLGVVVSKRIMKKAVARNYYKRLARDVFRHECAGVTGADFVVRPRETIEPDAAVTARIEMANLLRRAHSQCRNRQSVTIAG